MRYVLMQPLQNLCHCDCVLYSIVVRYNNNCSLAPRPEVAAPYRHQAYQLSLEPLAPIFFSRVCTKYTNGCVIEFLLFSAT